MLRENAGECRYNCNLVVWERSIELYLGFSRHARSNGNRHAFGAIN